MKGFIATGKLKGRKKSEARNRIRRGEYTKIRNGLYVTDESLWGGMVDIGKIVPGGVLCLYSAWAYYDMTTRIPGAYYVAIDRDRKLRKVDFIEIKPVYVSSSLLGIGRTVEVIDGYRVAIYDRERCVCDAVKYRNKVGIDVMQEVINSYLRYAEKDLGRLMDYAKAMRVYGKLKSYMEVRV